MGSYYKQQLNDWKATLDVKADVVFDIGGAQSPIRGMTRSWEVNDYKIIDLEIPHSEAPAPDIAWDMNDSLVEKIKELDHISKVFNGADIVFCLGVFDYVINPNIAMDNLKALMKNDGYAWVEFPFAYAHHEPVMDEGCRYSEGCINRLAKQSGLKITDMIRKMERSGLLRQWYAVEGQRAARAYEHHGVTGFIVKFEKN